MIYDYTDIQIPEQDPYEKCYSCKDHVPYDEVDEYSFWSSKKAEIVYELVCTRCTESFGN